MSAKFWRCVPLFNWVFDSLKFVGERDGVSPKSALVINAFCCDWRRIYRIISFNGTICDLFWFFFFLVFSFISHFIILHSNMWKNLHKSIFIFVLDNLQWVFWVISLLDQGFMSAVKTLSESLTIIKTSVH